MPFSYYQHHIDRILTVSYPLTHLYHIGCSKSYLTHYSSLLLSVFTLDTAQIKGVDSTVRETLVEMEKNSRLYVTERLMTEGEQTAESNIEVRLNGEESSAQIISRSVGKGNSVQTFHPKAVGNNKCQAHIQCDSIIMDHAEIGSIPEIRARDLNAAIIHEAAIGRINDEQLLKLRTLGLTEEEAENVIIENFLN